jgi:hypothetical protein
MAELNLTMPHASMLILQSVESTWLSLLAPGGVCAVLLGGLLLWLFRYERPHEVQRQELREQRLLKTLEDHEAIWREERAQLQSSYGHFVERQAVATEELAATLRDMRRADLVRDYLLSQIPADEAELRAARIVPQEHNLDGRRSA